MAHPAPGRPVRLGQDERDVMSGIEQAQKGVLGEMRCPRED
jgi:hypothetical protein